MEHRYKLEKQVSNWLNEEITRYLHFFLQMSQIFDLFNDQRKYKMFASSLLLAYDAEAVKKFVEGEIDRNELGNWIIVRVIDFAHVFPAEGERDDNFLSGLENLLTLFKACLNNKE